MQLTDLETPALLLDRGRMMANIERLRAALEPHGVDLRPHLKTAKSAEVARLMTDGWSGAVTVSTLKEADQFFEAGYRDILYAVGMAPNKLGHAARLRQGGADLILIVDSIAAAEAVSSYGREAGLTFPILIEIDSDKHRAGVDPSDAGTLVAIGRTLHESAGTELRGVMTHGGGSYGAFDEEALAAHAELERSGAVQAAETLHAASLPCPIVSVGSTPTAFYARHLAGVTEVRAGVYVFQDLVMSGLGVCSEEDIAIGVLTSVIGHQREKNWLIVDAGWMALSRDRGTAGHKLDQGYGLVCDIQGRPLHDLIVASANQEHGIIADRHGRPLDADRFAIGSLLRVLPNHACATAAQHDRYYVVDDGEAIEAVWPRFSGW